MTARGAGDRIVAECASSTEMPVREAFVFADSKPPVRKTNKLKNKENSHGQRPILQDPFLNALRKEHVPVSIYLVNGIKLQGQIDSFDQFVVLLKNTVSQMVYKHAISTVVPARAVRLAVEEGAAAETRGGMMHLATPPGMFERPRAGERAVLVRLGLGAAGQARGSRGVPAAGALGGRRSRWRP